MGSLQDALAKAGLVDERRRKPSTTETRREAAGGADHRTGAAVRNKPARSHAKHAKKPVDSASDLARAYAARARAERAEIERSKAVRVAEQEARRQRNLVLENLVAGQALNDPEAELPRYFEHLGRVRRVLCTPEQRAAINAGSLGVVGLRGRYLIVDGGILEAWRQIAPDLVPDLTGAEPAAGEAGDEYPAVPDDLVW